MEVSLSRYDMSSHVNDLDACRGSVQSGLPTSSSGDRFGVSQLVGWAEGGPPPLGALPSRRVPVVSAHGERSERQNGVHIVVEVACRLVRGCAVSSGAFSSDCYCSRVSGCGVEERRSLTVNTRSPR